MNQTVAVWLLIVIALAAANLPFINERLFGLIPLGSGKRASDAADAKEVVSVSVSARGKSFFLRVIELVVLYSLIGLLGYLFESTLGNPFNQRWEFYAITFSLFVVLAFPGFVIRYLMQRG
jgi:hypothetical protein